MSLEPPTNQRNITDDVTCLVADELIGPAQGGAQHPIVGQHDDVLDIAAQGEAALPQPRHLALEPEGTRPGDFPTEAVGVDGPLAGLPPDDWVIPVHADGKPEFVGRRHTVRCTAHAQYKGCAHHKGDGIPGLLAHPTGLEGVQPRLERSIQNRQFRPVHFDSDVVQAECEGGGEEMLHGIDGVIALTKPGAPLGGADAMGTRGHCRRLAAVLYEGDAAAGRPRPADDAAGDAGMKGDPGERDLAFQRAPRHRGDVAPRGARARR